MNGSFERQVRLGDDADPETVALQPARQQRHAKGGMIDISIA